METLKNLAIVALSVVFVIQLIPPPWNTGGPVEGKALPNAFFVPEPVQQVLTRSCYDCHSNSTKYPWFANVQPVGWWLNTHIVDGKRELNFDVFAAYRPARQFRKFQEIKSEIEEAAMPLPSYLITHNDARVSYDDRQLLVSWAEAMRDSMKARYPLDSLERRR